MARVAIIGSKNFGDQQTVERVMESLPTLTTLVIPTMRGPNIWAEEFAKAHGFPRPVICAIPKGKRTDEEFRSLCLQRNQRIASECDMLVAFWQGDCYNSRQLIELVAQMNKPVVIVGNEPSNRRLAHVIDYILGSII